MQQDSTVSNRRPESSGSFLTTTKEFFIRYPAVLSGYIIYSYLLITTIDFFLDVKNSAKHIDAFDLVKQFDSLIWMWLLALALVKIIEFRTKLHEKEKDDLVRQRKSELQATQLETLKEVVRGLQHEINNPLTIILMYLRRLEKMPTDPEEVKNNAREIRSGAHRIARTLRSFASTTTYEATTSAVGKMASVTSRSPKLLTSEREKSLQHPVM